MTIHSLKKFFKNKKILITLGSTREYLDPVRFISNGSSGKMGLALARCLKKFGAKIYLICGPSVACAEDFSAKSIVSALEMLKEVKKKFSGMDFFISAAAVSDYRPQKTLRKKIKRNNSVMRIALVPNPDILATVTKKKTKQFCVGFALESHHALRNAIQKMKKKRCDLMILNSPDAIESDMIRAKIIFADGRIWHCGRFNKNKFAGKICQAIAQSNPNKNF